MVDPYVQPNGTLKNLFRITDPDRLSLAETDLVLRRRKELPDVINDVAFDFARLKAIHQHLFQDVYDWAGRSRTTPLGKLTHEFGRDVHWFAHPDHIEPRALLVFAELQRLDDLRGLARSQFCAAAADFLIALNNLHPFREGNGRTQRTFLCQLAKKAGHPLDFSVATRERMIRASIAGGKGDHVPMRRVFDDMTILERRNALSQAIGFLNSHGFAWNDVFIAHTAPGDAYKGTVAGIAGSNFILRDETDVFIGRTVDLPSGTARGSQVAFIASGQKSDTETAKLAFQNGDLDC